MDIDVVEGENIYGFRHNCKMNFLKITLSQPRLMASAKRVCETGQYENVCGWHSPNLHCFEANIDFEIRFA